MAKLPVEIVRIGDSFRKEISEVVSLIDNVQTEFEYSILKPTDEVQFQLLHFKQANAKELLGKINIIRNALKGYHPFLIIITDIDLSSDELTNIFGDAIPEEGLAIFTFNNISDKVIARERIKAYIAYFIARYTFNFLIPLHRNHEESRECVFDKKIIKTDIIKSMKAGAICDSCRAMVMNHDYSISASQFACINEIFKKVEQLYTEDMTVVEAKSIKPKIFIGSSTEGLSVARKLKMEIDNDYNITIWNQGIFDKLGRSYLEVLEDEVNKFDYGVFIFTPDDTVYIRGEEKTIARDNVIFELGMFVGKLSRVKAFVVYPISSKIHILSDFAGITMAGYDSTNPNLQAAIGSVCEKIRVSIAATS